MFPIISTAWCVFWLYKFVSSFDEHRHSAVAVFIAWFMIGWLPPIFYKLMAMNWGG